MRPFFFIVAFHLNWNSMDKFIIRIYIIILLASCSDPINNPTIRSYDNPTDFDEIFDTFWINMSSNYVYWDNWFNFVDQIYEKYKPLFHQLHLSVKPIFKNLFSYFRAITSGLIDCHYEIEFSSKYLSTSPTINPGFDRKMNAANYRPPYDFQPLVYVLSGCRLPRRQWSRIQCKYETLSTLSARSITIILYLSCNRMLFAWSLRIFRKQEQAYWISSFKTFPIPGSLEGRPPGFAI